jgi:hypothetical protein
MLFISQRQTVKFDFYIGIVYSTWCRSASGWNFCWLIPGSMLPDVIEKWLRYDDNVLDTKWRSLVGVNVFCSCQCHPELWSLWHQVLVSVHNKSQDCDVICSNHVRSCIYSQSFLVIVCVKNCVITSASVWWSHLHKHLTDKVATLADLIITFLASSPHPLSIFCLGQPVW